MIAFYYLLRIGEYAIKADRNETKQTKQFKVSDIRFFRRCKLGRLRLLPREAGAGDVMTADGATLRLENQKNGWKNVCIFQEATGDRRHCPVRALGRRYCHIRENTEDSSTFLLAYFVDGKRKDVTAEDVSKVLKYAAACLDYPGKKGIPVDRIDTHLLRCRGANALALAGYSDTQIQKMGRWKGKTFKEYIRSSRRPLSRA